MTLDPVSMLFLLWAANNSKGKGGANAANKKRAPQWPTPKSPPPMPAFQPRATAPSADATKTSTPLAVLHSAPPAPPPASAIETAKAKATAAVRKHTTSLLAKQAARFNPLGKKAAPATSSALVSQLQTILTNHGVKISRDGLYGPRTASAWASLAKRKGLPPAITREGPKVAKVVTRTFEQLNVPPIP